MCQNFRTNYAVPNAIVITTVFISFILYYQGYYKPTVWNRNAVQTNCLVNNHSIINKTCSYHCNCTVACESDNIEFQYCIYFCNICKNICYDGTINASYMVNNKTVYNWYTVINGKNISKMVKMELEESYPINTNIVCYYNKHNSTDSRIILRDYLEYFYASILTIICCISFLMGWLIAGVCLSYTRTKIENDGYYELVIPKIDKK